MVRSAFLASAFQKMTPVPSPQVSRILAVDSKGRVNRGDLDAYMSSRREEVAKRLQACFQISPVAKRWFDDLSEKDLYEEKDGEQKYLGDPSAEGDALAAMAKAKATVDPMEMVSAVEDLIMCFCGFHGMKPLKAKCIINALHFQYEVDVDRLLGISLSLPSADGDPTEAEKALFDDANVASAELLLRCVVETGDGSLVASPFSPGMAMGKLLKLPLFAQFVLVLTNAVEAVWYHEAIPSCPTGINLYASLLVAEAPVLQMIEGVSVVEIMEMSKGAKRGPEVDEWVGKIREIGALVLLDDFDASHPGAGSKPNGIKVSVFANAFHSLQTLKNQPLGESRAPLLPISEMPYVEKEKANAFDVMDYYCSIVPKYQSGAQFLVMEGSENCTKSESAGPPLNFGEPKATTASAHVYQAAARSMRASQPEGQVFRMFHQGGRALYKDEDFDEDACAVIAASGKSMVAARTGDAGTMAWMGQEAVRRATMQARHRVSGFVRQPAQTVVVGIVGMSCSGKSTAAGKLSALLNGSEVQVICQDDFFKFDQYLTDLCPRKDFASHAWKDWETAEAFDWLAFASAIERAKTARKSPFLVIEGFQLCAREETRSLLDVVVALDLPKAECWQRRKSRAQSMRHLPPGTGDDNNYEVLDTYIFGESPEARSSAQDAVQAAAAASAICAEEGDDAWLRLYFEEMVWPEAERSREDHKCGKPVFSIDASRPSGKEEWLAEWMPQAAAFVQREMQPPAP